MSAGDVEHSGKGRTEGRKGWGVQGECDGSMQFGREARRGGERNGAGLTVMLAFLRSSRPFVGPQQT